MKLPKDHVAGVGIVKTSGYGGIGQKLLEKMGWNEGDGLGKDKNGIREAVKFRTQTHSRGLGHVAASDWTDHQWANMYESSLKQMAKPTKDGTSSDDEIEKEAVVGVRKNPDGTETTAAVEELQLYHLLQSKKKLGGWSSRRGKLARIRKQEVYHMRSEFSPLLKKPRR